MTFTVEHLGTDVMLYCGDALEVLPTLPAGSVDAVVTDPPYGINYCSGHDGYLPRSIAGDRSTQLRDAVIHAYKSRPMAVFATWRCIPPVRPRGCLVWAKNVGGMGDLSYPWQGDFEMIWIYGKGWKGHRGSSVLKAETVCTWNSGPAKRSHPHEKPVGLMRQILEKLPQDAAILDPFAGSGTTGVACVQLGRRFVGIEICEDYYQIAKRRISDAQLQMRLL